MISNWLSAALARRNIHYGWAMVAVTFLTALISAGTVGAPGVFIVPLQKEFGWTTAEISSALSIRFILFGLMAPFAAALMNRYGLRNVTLLALLIVVSGLVASLAMTQVWHLMLLWGVVIGLGTGMTALVLGVAPFLLSGANSLIQSRVEVARRRHALTASSCTSSQAAQSCPRSASRPSSRRFLHLPGAAGRALREGHAVKLPRSLGWSSYPLVALPRLVRPSPIRIRKILSSTPSSLAQVPLEVSWTSSACCCLAQVGGLLGAFPNARRASLRCSRPVRCGCPSLPRRIGSPPEERVFSPHHAHDPDSGACTRRRFTDSPPQDLEKSSVWLPIARGHDGPLAQRHPGPR